MHTCLNVAEIVRFVARELTVFPWKATAVSLACCCKSFEDPVLDVLWATQVSLYPILDCFPEGVWSAKYSFKRLPTTTELARIRKYARRMRKLDHRPTKECREIYSVMPLWSLNGPLFPNLESLTLLGVYRFIPSIPLCLSHRTTSVFLIVDSDEPNPPPEALLSSIIITLPTLCPDLQTIDLRSLPGDQMTTAAVTEMLLTTNRNTLQKLDVNCPLTEEASEVICKLPGLRSLSVTVTRGSLLPSASLPNLAELYITCDDESGWPGFFRGATFGKLKSVTLSAVSKQIGDFFGTFARVALPSSTHNALSNFSLRREGSWNPNHSSLPPFTELVALQLQSSCMNRCSSTVDDDLLINLSRAMPKLKVLELGDAPCGRSTGGVTTKGLIAVSCYCPDLDTLLVHFQVASLCTSPTTPGMIPNAEPTTSWTNSTLTQLEAGEIPMPEESALVIALTLLLIFPRIVEIHGCDQGWQKVEEAICRSREIVDCSKAGLGISD